jgi:hypothetical protein
MGLSPYTREGIYSYELVRESWEVARKVCDVYNKRPPWPATATKCMVLNKAISDRNGSVSCDRVDTGAHITRGGRRRIAMVTLDEEVERLHMKVGFIKADVEGHGLEVLKGAMKMLERDHPVLSIAIYHGTEFLNVPQFLKELGFYRLELRTETVADATWISLGDLRVFAVPLELL